MLPFNKATNGQTDRYTIIIIIIKIIKIIIIIIIIVIIIIMNTFSIAPFHVKKKTRAQRA